MKQVGEIMAGKWKVELEGYFAIVSLNIIGQLVRGTLASDVYGIAPIENGILSGGAIRGSVTLNGIHADVTASIMPDGSLQGKVRVGWFFSEEFTGTPCE